MILRILNFIVIGALVLAAAYVYRIKFNSTVQAEHLAKLSSQLRHERDLIAALRAEWGQLQDPARIEGLTKRYLQLKPVVPTQFDSLDHLPDRPAEDARKPGSDPIGGIIENLEEPDSVTGSVPDSAAAPSDTDSEAPGSTPAADNSTPAAANGAPSP